MGLPPRVPRMPSTLTAADAQRFASDVGQRIGASAEDAARLAELLVRAEVGYSGLSESVATAV